MDAVELAYLFTCSTAARGLRADEPTNLASAFHLAGFRHVVATLWPLTDTAAAHAAQTFYDTLDTVHTVRAVARELRARYPHRPDLWAALIHSGP
jgi:CHAT domain-containing protein